MSFTLPQNKANSFNAYGYKLKKYMCIFIRAKCLHWKTVNPRCFFLVRNFVLPAKQSTEVTDQAQIFHECTKWFNEMPITFWAKSVQPFRKYEYYFKFSHIRNTLRIPRQCPGKKFNKFLSLWRNRSCSNFTRMYIMIQFIVVSILGENGVVV